MSDPARLGDLFADDALLDRLATRGDVGDEPLALVLGSLASFVDEPIGPHRVVARRRGWRGRRVALAGLMAVVMSGAGIAAALTLPDVSGQLTAPGQHVDGGATGTTSTGTPWPARPAGTSPTLPPGAARPASLAGAGVVRVVPSGPLTTGPGAISPNPAGDDSEPPGLVSGPSTPAATSPSESVGHHHGRPTTRPTPPGQGRTAHPPGRATATPPPSQSPPPTSPAG